MRDLNPNPNPEDQTREHKEKKNAEELCIFVFCYRRIGQSENDKQDQTFKAIGEFYITENQYRARANPEYI